MKERSKELSSTSREGDRHCGLPTVRATPRDRPELAELNSSGGSSSRIRNWHVDSDGRRLAAGPGYRHGNACSGGALLFCCTATTTNKGRPIVGFEEAATEKKDHRIERNAKKEKSDCLDGPEENVDSGSPADSIKLKRRQ